MCGYDLYLLQPIIFFDSYGGGEDIKEGVISDPMLLYGIFYAVYSGITCKKSARNL